MGRIQAAGDDQPDGDRPGKLIIAGDRLRGAAGVKELPEQYGYSQAFLVFCACERMAWLSPALFASMSAEDQAMILAFEVIRRQEDAAQVSLMMAAHAGGKSKR